MAQQHVGRSGSRAFPVSRTLYGARALLGGRVGGGTIVASTAPGSHWPDRGPPPPIRTLTRPHPDPAAP